MLSEGTRKTLFRATVLRALAGCFAVVCFAINLAHVSSAEEAQHSEQLQAADNVLEALSRNDFSRLAGTICRGEKLSYSPYATNLTRLFIASFSALQVASFGTSPKKYVWGKHDGTGAAIRLTPREYHGKFVYDVDYRNLSAGKTLDFSSANSFPELRALRAVYPNAIIMSYRYRGTEDLGYKDARELYLAFLEADGRWCLKGIAHSEDTT
jgi:hypothetical protein